ncbi:glycoside hydrolase family 3 protein [Demequina globuliformis]|uniref:glycoside hydrolase family 3 protein n=1 Tax=Demequina globuliformis TaxID=676202 RepID=UPI00078341E8|nr:glycoside hydrolase family 3 N-terminal domain-containing protein [Demequina globuliformis]
MAGRYPYEDPAVGLESRIDDLLARMELEDKVGLLYHQYVGITDPEQPDQYGRPGAAEHIRERRMSAFFVQGSPPTARDLAEIHNALQRVALEHPLGVPVTLATDPRHSVTDNPLTANAAGAAFSAWPEALGLAATRSTELVESFAETARQEYLAVGIRVGAHPQIDVTTEPRWARMVGTFGEDAELTGRLGAAYVRGFRGRDAGDTLTPLSVATMPKHFPGGGPQKDGLDPHFSDGKEQVYPGGFFEYHLQPFIDVIKAGATQMMPYYGMPVGTEHEEVGFAFNKSVITGILRERLEFDGIVCTDFGVITGYGEHFPAKAWGVEHLSEEDRVVRLLEAGVDQFGGENRTEHLMSAVKGGRVTEARIDQSVRRLLREKFRLGLFDDARFVDADQANSIVGRLDFREAGVAAQKASLTLLTNGPSDAPTLPARPGIKVYVEGVEPEAFAGYANVVATPSEADLAVVRVSAPNHADPAKSFLGSMHKGSLEYSDGDQEHLLELINTVPTVIDVFFDRPPILEPLMGAAALVASFGTSDRPFVEVLFGDGQPGGALPLDVPRSMAAVLESREDVPFDTHDPLFRYGHGLSYAMPVTVTSDGDGAN